MLRAVNLVAQWREHAGQLPGDWADARMLLTVEDEALAARGAALLGPATPARRGRELRFYCARRGAGISPGALERLLARVDAEGIAGRLELRAVDQPTEQQPETHRATLAATWDALLESLPPDWSDVYGEIELESSDWLERAALLLSPLNPSRYGGLPGFRFRVSRRFGYGTSTTMTRRSLERLDEERIRGELRILYALSDTQPVGTQGPVFRLEGRAV
jgi:hypothetical protein